jgi:hypothetical protein
VNRNIAANGKRGPFVGAEKRDGRDLIFKKVWIFTDNLVYILVYILHENICPDSISVRPKYKYLRENSF